MSASNMAQPTPRRYEREGDGDEPPPKKRTMRGNRNQPIVSCLECRRMKWKCDREFPCANCRKRGLEDLCPEGRLNGAKGDRQLVVSLQSRVQELEAALAEAQKRLFPQTQTSHPLLNTTHVTFQTERQDSAGIQEGTTENGTDDENLDEDHGQLTLGDEPGASGFFGPAGATFLTRGEKEDRNQTGQTWQFGFEGTPSGLTDSFPLSSRAVSLEELHGHLPSREVAERLTGIYFNHASFLNHMVNRSTFARDYLDAVYRHHDPSSRINNHRLALVYLVLATGAQMDITLPPCNDIGESYYQLCRACLAYDPSGSVTFVQCIHMMGRYMANASKGPVSSQNFWTILGLGVRCAQQVGLHRDGVKWGLERDEVEHRRRVFREIYAEDLFQSITQGRPCLMTPSTIDVLFPSLSPNPDSFELYHHYKYRLSKIMARINELQTRATTVPYNEVMEVDKALRQLQQELPPVLLLTTGEEQHMYRNISLRLYFTEGFMFLHRNRFTRALRGHPREPLESPYRYSYVSQLESSRIMLDILRDVLILNTTLTCRFWIFFFHAFTSMVNFCATIIRSPTSSLAAAIFDQVAEGIKLFDVVGVEHKARDDLTTLRRLFDRARAALISNKSSRDQESANLIGLGTTLHRVRPKSTSPNASFAPHPINHGTMMLPTTLADAVAVQHDLFNLPFDFGNGITDFTSETSGSVPDNVRSPPQVESFASGWQIPWTPTHSTTHTQMNAVAGMVNPVEDNGLLAMGIHPDLDLELDFDAFLAELGMSPQRV